MTTVHRGRRDGPPFLVTAGHLAAPPMAPSLRSPRDEQARVVLHSIADAVITTNRDGRITYLNASAERLTGWTMTEARNRPLDTVLRLISETTREAIANTADRCIAEDRSVDLEDGVLLCRRDGSEVPIGDSTAPIRAPDGTIVGVVLVIQDESEKRRIGNQLFHDATHDALTGLLNRRGFEDRLARLAAELDDTELPHVLLYLDLDGFKSVNDTLGHLVGDELLRRLGEKFSGYMRESDRVARLGGDEFAILLENCPLAEARKIADRVLAGVAQIAATPDSDLRPLRASIGLIQVTAARGATAAAMKAADAACYQAKKAGGNQVVCG